MSRFGKRAPREQSYVRFGRAPAPESSYVRFGKRRGGLAVRPPPADLWIEAATAPEAAASSRPCTIEYLATLETVEEKLRHLRSCFMPPRSTRGRQAEQGYVR